jgi:predicted alpha/beta superfamily hydrolase
MRRAIGLLVVLLGGCGRPESGTTVLRIHYPAGSQTVTLRGSGGPLNWQSGLPATPGPDNTWTFTTTAITAPIEWKALLDDTTWSHGPNYHVAPGQTLDVYPHFSATRGQVVNLLPGFYSTRLQNYRNVWAYLPPSYNENTTARFPVVYMHDGQNLFDPSKAAFGVEWRADEAIDAAAESGVCPTGDICQDDEGCGGLRCETFREAIIIGPENTLQRIYEYTPTSDPDFSASGGGDLYLQMLIEEIKPVVDNMLRTRPERAHTGLAGSSLGGLISAYGGVRNSDVFGLLGVFSPSSWWDDRVILTEVASIPGRPQRGLRVYVDSGDSGPSNDGVEDTRLLAQSYRDVGYVAGADFRFVVAPGHEHNEYYWSLRLPGALAFLLGPREQSP